MPLSADQTADAARQYARKLFVEAGATANLNHDDIVAAVTALTTFIENNAMSINNQFPEPFKSTATVAQKRYVLALSAMKLAGLI